MNDELDFEERERMQQTTTAPAPPPDSMPSAPILPVIVARRLDAIETRLTDMHSDIDIKIGITRDVAHEIRGHLQRLQTTLEIALRQWKASGIELGELRERVASIEASVPAAKGKT